MQKRLPKGFTLIEILIVLTIIAILVGLSVSAMLMAMERARQRRTMADIRTIANSVEAYSVDYNRYPPASGFILPPTLSLPTLTLGNMRPYIVPTYIRTLPLVDGWNSWITYGTSTGLTDYAIRSSARGGVPETSPVFGITTNVDADIIVVNGTFVQYPEGPQE